jgi:hypothetical protein
MMQMGWVLAESSGVLLLVSVGIEVALDNGVYNGHILNRWQTNLVRSPLLLALGEVVVVLDEAMIGDGA